ncbi:Predicted Zn-dependent peptidase [Hydrobacter penzbergensis]|uniref:Predicted Zn-dependent peptidase n=1 Tax=Hydrobacter penzbergensis TaxID=1235997 RepID=A0A8X8IG42_9BACT|nr:M16 family metallopeptidase [Hydrobacter penzbergensis]SDX13927.1 Predicted Zn-dependent peptidase [Hydrobacter penzbergensis]
MKWIKSVGFVALVMIVQVNFAQTQYEWKQATSGGYTYKYVTNDPMHARFYTLRNGLTVVLSVNKKEPRIAVRIPVRAGSNTDPRDHTGLAHYLEHLLFKGTDKYGTLDWAKEKPYLDKIDALYEQYNSTKDEAARKEIYKEIDKTSGEAAKHAIANEYDKMMAAMGGQGSNAHTWVEETVYEEDIPSNALEKFVDLQAERFRNPILRIFHTELEAVYEEKNRSLDEDAWKIQEASHFYLFPTHNYGQQTTIGTIEHLKNPSINAIRDYYHKYYVPNNMAIVMSGDLDPDKTIRLIDAKFSYMNAKPIQEYKPSPEKPITESTVKDIFGPSAESLQLDFRVGPANSKEALLADLTSSVLSNGKAGLLDLNLNKQQKVLRSNAGVRQYKDYGVFIINASPKQGQTLEEAKDLVMEQLDILKKGNFDASLIKAIVANYKLQQLQGLENNANRVEEITDGFIKNKGLLWNDDVAVLDKMGKVTKEELVAFANQFFHPNNYVLLYKRKGEAKGVAKVEKPPITPVETNADKQSPFVKAINGMSMAPVKPVWLNFATDMQRAKAGKAEVLYVPNKDNGLFNLQYRFEMGGWNDKLLPLALQYLQFIGTEKKSSEDISKAFYNLACSFNANAGNEETTVSLNGLQENFDKASTLLEDLVRNCKADEAALEGMKNRLMRARANNKLNKSMIMTALRNYGVYGEKNPFNYTLTDAEIKDIKAADLVNILHNLFNYQHRVIYYGPKPLAAFATDIAKIHQLPAAWMAAKEPAKFTRRTQGKNEVLFADYDMVQSEIFWVRNLDAYDPKKEAVTGIFNNYFGFGMGAIVFQTIRESKALAYSTFAVLQTPAKKEDQFAFMSYVGCQADKFNEAVAGMNDLLNNLPEAAQNFDNAKKSLLKDYETERITKENIVSSYLANLKKGVDHDLRKDVYEQAASIQFSDIKGLHDTDLSQKPYTYCIVASEKKLKEEDMKKIGDVKKLSLAELFGY